MSIDDIYESFPFLDGKEERYGFIIELGRLVRLGIGLLVAQPTDIIASVNNMPPDAARGAEPMPNPETDGGLGELRRAMCFLA